MNIRVRRGSLRDAGFIRSLAVRSVEYGIPDTRAVSVEAVRRDTKKALRDLEVRIHDSDFCAIIAEDLDTGKSVGYLMLLLNEREESTGELQSFIYDIAVEKSYWGKYVTDKLMGEAEVITREHGLRYITATISASNRRSFVYATKRLNYQVERYQIVKVLSSDE